VRRLLPASLLLTLLAAACSETVAVIPCPGSPVATFQFTNAPLTLARCDSGGPAAGMNALYPATVSFTGTVSYAASGNVAALCNIHPGAEPLVGTQVADQLDLALGTRGALLSGCNAACAVTVQQRVTGTLLRDPGGAPSGFTGELVDEQKQDPAVPAADCSPCGTPCQARYALTGLPVGP